MCADNVENSEMKMYVKLNWTLHSSHFHFIYCIVPFLVLCVTRLSSLLLFFSHHRRRTHNRYYNFTIFSFLLHIVKYFNAVGARLAFSILSCHHILYRIWKATNVIRMQKYFPKCYLSNDKFNFYHTFT